MNRPQQVAATGCMLLAMATAGCGTAADGVLQGKSVNIGGPAISATETPVHPNSGQQIYVLQNGTVISSATTRSDGSFTFTLHPGRYNVRSSEDCTGSVAVVINANKTTDVTLSCQIP